MSDHKGGRGGREKGRSQQAPLEKEAHKGMDEAVGKEGNGGRWRDCNSGGWN
ncbi:hypothetical protein P7K49_003558 [Saguinus oedipus]|uniref:Uncharacterized protein n=1 Tax=Saguinus oedipus TaxID=9490 RepID=A0ABQ9W4V4_SAGOE|nr:hypothetical protein P7K49_003558 [Saguinus oedipus]